MDDSNVPQRMKKKKSGGIYMKNIISRKVIYLLIYYEII